MMRVRVHVHPGATHAAVAGSYDGALEVRVRARAHEGAATSEVLGALADAFELRRADVLLVRGARSRTKLVDLRGDDDVIADRLRALLESPEH